MVTARLPNSCTIKSYCIFGVKNQNADRLWALSPEFCVPSEGARERASDRDNNPIVELLSRILLTN